VKSREVYAVMHSSDGSDFARTQLTSWELSPVFVHIIIQCVFIHL